MSKLSRFKKAPALKLPKVISSPKHQRRASRLGDDSSDSEDDFKESLRKPSKIAPQNKPKPSTLDSNSTKEKAFSTASSISEYFPIAKLTQTTPNEGSKVSHDDLHTENIIPKTSPIKSTKPDDGTRRNKALEKETKTKKNTIKTIDKVKVDPDEKSLPLKDGVAGSEILCPFCWKKLADTMTGTTHIKSCAKNIPIPQIYEAMQLQDKQIKEWQNLGLEFPGFSNVNKKAKPGTTKGKGKGGNRRKKQEIPDPDLELAIALSRSLQEEIDQRENVNIIESETKNNIELVRSPPQKTHKPLNEHKFAVPSKNGPIAAAPKRRRGKMTSFKHLPLHTVDLERKKAIVSERVSQILDESEKKDDDGIFFVRDDVSASVNYFPKNLAPFLNPGPSVWHLAQGSPETPEETISVLKLPTPDSKEIINTGIDQPILLQTNCNERGTCSNDKIYNPGVGNSISNKTSPFKSNKSFGASKSRNTSTPAENAMVESLPAVIRDIALLFINKTDTDVVIYGREEKPIHCHRLILLARCPNLLKEMILENKPSRISKAIIPLTMHTHEAVKAFIWYLYTGNVVTKGNEKLLTEIQDLGHLYGVDIVIDDMRVSTGSPHLLPSAVVQTATVKESMENKIPNKSLNDGRNTSISQELFRTFEDSHVSIGHHEPKLSRDVTPIGSPLPSKEAEDHTRDLEDACSVDLFEDSDEDIARCPSLKVNAEISMPICENQAMSSTSDKVSFKSCSFDDEDYLNDLISPTPHEMSVNKRSRSVSPYLDDSNRSYTASQIVNILKVNQDGGDVDEYIQKAIKKPKLDFNDSYFDKMCNDNFETNISTSNIKISDESNKFENHSDSVVSVTKSKQCSSKLITTVTPSKSLSLRKSISTPNLTLCNYSSTPLNHQQINFASTYDPLVDACDDSVFANIPEFVFSPSKKISPEMPIFSNKNSIGSGTPTRFRRGVSPSPRVLTSVETCSSISKDKETRKERQTKTKAKSQPKIKLPRQAQTQELRVPLYETSSVDVSNDLTRRYNNKSPMLNYSLIDTPILKQELNKFGIKPLPRSKAKVLLRHIYKETHK